MRECFGDPSLPQTQLEVDIWQLVIVDTDIQSVSVLAQTSTAFNQLVEEKFRKNNLKLAKRYLIEGQTRMARKCLENCVEHGNPEAMFCMAYGYMCGGWGLQMDDAEMFRYFGLASDAGNPRAMIYYACLCRGTIHCLDTKPLVERALASGDFLACGYYYYQWSVDLTKAFEYFTKSAMEGDEYAQFLLGECYYHGDGTPQNKEKSLEWYAKSAEQGLRPAMLCMSRSYPYNYKDCIKWNRMAAKQKYIRNVY